MERRDTNADVWWDTGVGVPVGKGPRRRGHSPEVLKAMKDNVEEAKRLGIEAIDD